MDRRQLLLGFLAVPLTYARPGFAGEQSTFIADMHFHSFFFRPDATQLRPLAKAMADGNVTLASWSLVGDVPWLRPTKRGFQQKGTPKQGETLRWFQQELDRIKKHLASQNLRIVRTAADVDLALKGVPHVVISVEGASFVDEDIGQLRAAYDQGIRHVQLVHYIRNPIGDFQTEPPRHNRLTEFGREVITECNRLGILVDLAHCTREVVMEALAVSKTPMVWSHSSVAQSGDPNWSMVAWKARQISAETAKAIAAKGGVVGLWGVRSDVGPSVESYANRLSKMADLLGEDHVGFGSDMNALKNPVLAKFSDLRRVVRHWERHGVSATRIRKIAIENYARVLRESFAARQA
jgi:membrane dipeptidase